jgi:cell division septation protein DedD
VQLGSFSSAASAQRLSDEFRSNGFDAFVMPVKTGSTTLYRVRLGPMKDRTAAESVLKRAKTKVAGAAIVAHP